MSVLTYRFTPPDLANRFPDLRKAYVTGLDRSPGRVNIAIRDGMLTCRRDNPESVRLHVPWPVEGFGAPFIATATLSARDQPYNLAVELARGRLNDVRNQVADWTLLGLQPPAELARELSASQRAFARAATSQEDPEASNEASQASLQAAFRAAELLVRSYTEQVLQRRREGGAKLSTQLACVLEGEPKRSPWMAPVLDAVNAATIQCNWATLAPTEGRYRWEMPDAHLAWCRAARLSPIAGPLLDLRPGALPDWLWLWEGDYEEIEGLALDLVRTAVGRYRGKVGVWHLLNRPGSSEILGLSEEEQVRLAAKALQVARQADPNAQLVVGFDRPWGEWLASSPFQLGPLHLADALARAELGLSGIGLEIAPGFSAPGSHMRDLLDFSRLLDTYALINLPLHVSLALPSADAADPQADPSVRVERAQWPAAPDEETQRAWAERWARLAIAKPFVRSVQWTHLCDAAPHLYPNAGLFRADQTPKPVVGVLRSLRSSYLS